MVNVKLPRNNQPRSTRRTFIQSPFVYLTAVFIITLSILLCVYAGYSYWLGINLTSQARHDLADRITPYGTGIHTELNRRTGRISGLVAFVKTHKGESDFGTQFSQFAENLYESDLGIRNFQVTVGTITRYVYPLEGQSQMIGMDWLAVDSIYKKDMETALKLKTATIIGPTEAHKGIYVLAAAEPVFNNDGSLFGIVAAVYDLNILIKNSQLADSQTSLDLAVRTADKQMVYGSEEVFRSEPVTRRVAAGESYWEVGAIPKNGWTAYVGQEALPERLTGLALVFLLVVIITGGLNSQRYLRQVVTRSTEELSEVNKDLIDRIDREAAALEALARLNTLYVVISKINELIVKTKDQKKLLKEICQILVEDGGFRMAWIGLVGKKDKRVGVAASAGEVGDYLKGLKMIVPKSADGHGPKTRALLDKRSYVCNDIEEDLDMVPWLQISRQHGYQAEAVFPLVVDDKLVGSLNIYSGEPGVFYEDVVGLLREITGDISYAIGALGKEEEKKEAEQQIARLVSFPRNNPNPVVEFNRRGLVQFCNDAAVKAMSSIGIDDVRLLEPEDFDDVFKELAESKEKKIISRVVHVKDDVFGETLYYDHKYDTLRVYASNITKRVRAEEQLKEKHNELEESYRTITNTFEGIVKALAALAEHKDPYTVGHERRVVALTEAICREMRLDKETAEGLKVAAALHDVGKIFIPGEILSKPTGLNELEYKMVKMHPVYSYEVLSKIDFKWPVADITVQHHERLDGSGYPNGLKGDGILLAARILAVADVVEAMLSHRPYRPAHSLDNALNEIKKNKGILYEAKVVEAVLNLFKKGYKLGGEGETA